jgi:hypothetical protein
VQILLYPEALLTGTITGPEGNPLRNIGVEALRATDDDLGRHWIFSAVTRSNAHGQFRMPVAAGDYRLQTDLSRALGTSAIRAKPASIWSRANSVSSTFILRLRRCWRSRRV